MVSYANDTIRLCHKLSSSSMQWSTVFAEWKYEPSPTQSSVKAQNFKKYPIYHMKELYMNGNW